MNYVFRALPLKRDSRTLRFGNFLAQDTIYNTWEDEYKKYSGLESLKRGKKELNYIVSYPMYLIYLFLFSLFKIKSNDRVICMELDVFIPIYLASFWKKSKIYLDIVDPIAQTKFRKIPFNKIFDYLEYMSLRFRKYNIVPNYNRIEYYKDRLFLNVDKLNYLLVENVPHLKNNVKSSKEFSKIYDIGYFGTLDESRGLIELVEFSNKMNLTLLIAGMGPLGNYIEEASKGLGRDKINFYGSFTANELSTLYSNIKFSWAYYTDKIFLHKYASPNKYYEHLAFKTPLVINKFVPLSDTIKEMNTGVVIDNELNIDNFIFLQNEIERYIFNENNFALWNEKYINYKVDFSKYEGKK